MRIRSSHEQEISTGAGPVRTLKKGSAEWAAAVQAIMGEAHIVKSVEEKDLESRQLLIKRTCKRCQDVFEHKTLPKDTDYPDYCCEHCALADVQIASGCCPQCRSAVEKHIDRQIYCGKKCLKHWHYKHQRLKVLRQRKLDEHTKLCEVCGQRYEKPETARAYTDVCSDVCKKKRRARTKREYEKRKRLPTVCALEGCSNTFERIRSKHNNRQMYCCRGCRDAARAERARKRRLEAAPEVLTLLCKICEAPFQPRRGHEDRSIICPDPECKRTHRVQHMREKRAAKRREVSG